MPVLIGSTSSAVIHKEKHLTVSEKRLKHYRNEGDSFLTGIITIDEPWVHRIDLRESEKFLCRNILHLRQQKIQTHTSAR